MDSSQITVETVAGSVSLDDLGKTLMHEHLVLGYPGWHLDSLYSRDRRKEVAELVGLVRPLARHGVSTIVDPCPIEMGRDPIILRDVSAASGIQIVCSTGIYHGRAGLLPYWRMLTIDEIAEAYVHEIEVGIGDTGIRAGLIKAATRAGQLVPVEERALRAAARAALATNVPILTHTEEGTLGLEQVKILRDEGVPAEAIIIGHCCNSSDLAYIRELLSHGVFVGYDQIGWNFRVSDGRRISHLVELIREGFAEQLILSQDRVGYWFGRLPAQLQEFQDAVTREGFTPIFDTFLPQLVSNGVEMSVVNEILESNPRRFFSALPRGSAAPFV